jgi:hypothetical protein
LEKDESGSISFSGGSYSPPDQPPIVPDAEFDEKELADLDEGEYVQVSDLGEGPMMAPPPSNSIREPSTFSQAPVFYRKPWCQRCFFGEDHQETRNCFSYSGVYGDN